MSNVKLTRAQSEALDAIIDDTKNGGWINPVDLPHWVKNQWQVCQILERKGRLISKYSERGTIYRPAPQPK